MAQESGLTRKSSISEKRRTFRTDLAALESSDLPLAQLDGLYVDSGVGFEIRYATAKGKTIIGLKTDLRSFSDLEEVNLNVEMSLKQLCRGLKSAIKALKGIKGTGR